MRKVSLIFLGFMLLCFVGKAQVKHTIGEKFGGGIVFDISADGLHGLIAESIDLGKSTPAKVSELLKTGKYSDEAKPFTDWRLPSKEELEKLHKQKDVVGGFNKKEKYMSSSRFPKPGANWGVHFMKRDSSPIQDYQGSAQVRVVRAF